MRFSPSRTALLLECQYWARKDVVWTDKGSPAATLGSAVHAALADIPFDTSRLSDSDVETYERMVQVGQDWAATNVPADAKSEQTMQWDVDDGDVFYVSRRDVDDDKSVYGTVDVMWHTYDDSAVVVDWKTGHNPGKACDSMQLKTYAAMVPGAMSVRVILVHLTVDAAYVSEHAYNDQDLAMQRIVVRTRLDLIPTSKPQPGAHCDELYCPARGTCPATTSAALALPSLTAAIQGPDHAAKVLAMAQQAEAALGAIHDALRAWADANGGIVGADGKTWKRRSMGSSKRTNIGALEWLARAQGATEDEIDACKTTSERSGFKWAK